MRENTVDIVSIRLWRVWLLLDWKILRNAIALDGGYIVYTASYSEHRSENFAQITNEYSSLGSYRFREEWINLHSDVFTSYHCILISDTCMIIESHRVTPVTRLCIWKAFGASKNVLNRIMQMRTLRVQQNNIVRIHLKK